MTVSAQSRYYPPVGFHFQVRVLDSYDGSGKVKNSSAKGRSQDSGFQEVSGISVEVPSQELHEGGENRFSWKLPLPVRYTPVQLKRGLVASSSELGSWCTETFANGFSQPVKVKNLLVSLLDEENNPLAAWVFIGAFPSGWTVSDFNAMNNNIVVETLELTYRRFEQVEV